MEHRAAPSNQDLSYSQLISLLLASLVGSHLICGILIRYQRLHISLSGDHDFVGPQKFHRKATCRIGGIGIAGGFLTASIVASLLNFQSAKFLALVALAASPIFFIGVAEDLSKRVGVKVRLVAAFSSGLLFLFIFDIAVIRLDIVIADSLMALPMVAVPFLAFAIAGLSNAYNIIDGLHGLASMVGIMAATALLYVSYEVQDPLVMSLTLLAIGSIVGFFCWNYPKGRIFLGDGGAYLIGFLIAIASILLVVRHQSVSPWFALMVNAYPVLETLFTIWRRAVRKAGNPGLPDAVHLHSLIYRRVIRQVHNDDIRSAKTSRYLWLLSSTAVIPALLLWDSTIPLMIVGVVFSITYFYAYCVIVNFKTSAVLGRLTLRGELQKSDD